MSLKRAIWAGMILGSIVGGWVPTLFGAEWISFAAVFGSTVGGAAGIALGYWVGRSFC